MAALLRIASFSALFALLPWKIVPWSVRVQLVLVLLIAVAPAALVTVQEWSFPSWQQSFAEVASGALWAVLLGASGFAAYLAGAWVSQLFFGSSARVLEGGNDRLTMLFLLLLLTVVLETSLFTETVAAFAESFLAPLPALGGTEQIALVGSSALRAAFVIALPFFAVSVLVDLFVIIVDRYARFFAELHVLGRVVLLAVTLLVLSSMVRAEFSLYAEHVLKMAREMPNG